MTQDLAAAHTVEPVGQGVPEQAAPPLTRDYTGAERFMRRLLRISTTDKRVGLSAHRAYRVSLVISGIRCLITYLAVPLLVPVVSFAQVLAAPIGIALCLVAFVSGIAGVRRFWVADHRGKWAYTWFMAAIFIILTVAVVADVARVIA